MCVSYESLRIDGNFFRISMSTGNSLFLILSKDIRSSKSGLPFSIDIRPKTIRWALWKVNVGENEANKFANKTSQLIHTHIYTQYVTHPYTLSEGY